MPAGIKTDAYDCPLVIDHDFAVGLFNYRKAMEDLAPSTEDKDVRPPRPPEPRPPKSPRKPRVLSPLEQSEKKIKSLENYTVLLKTEIKRLAALQIRQSRPKPVERPAKHYRPGTQLDICSWCDGYGLVEKK